MRLVIADCSARYSGRGDTILDRGVRTIMIKEDGSVSIHNDKSNKPLNYMKTANFIEGVNDLGELTWAYDARHENLTITLHKIIQNFEAPLIQDDPGLIKDGSEHDLQAWLKEHPTVLGNGFQVLEREFQTGNGPVDLLAVNSEGIPYAVEVKRTAMVGAVDQVRRYIDALEENADYKGGPLDFNQVRGMIAAVDIRPKTIIWAQKKGIELVQIPENWKTTDRDYLEGTVIRTAENSIYKQPKTLFESI